MTQLARGCVFGFVLLGVFRSGQGVTQAANEQEAQKSEDFVFDVQPRVIAAGETAVLRWSIKGATKVVIEETSESKGDLRKIGTFGGNGSLQVTPKGNTTYVITCEGSTTHSCASATVRVRVKGR